VLQPVEGDFIAQVFVTAEFPRKAKSVADGRLPFHAAGLLLMKDEQTYVRLDLAEMAWEGENASFINFELRKDGQAVRLGHRKELPVDTLVEALKREGARRGAFAREAGPGFGGNPLRQPADEPDRPMLAVGGSGGSRGTRVALRLERRGELIHASASWVTGTDWTSLTPIRLALPPRVRVGVVASHDTAAGFAPQFLRLRVLRAGP
jgi:hypothetical protein